jgi:hypothetical protein
MDVALARRGGGDDGGIKVVAASGVVWGTVFVESTGLGLEGRLVSMVTLFSSTIPAQFGTEAFNEST